jgi:dTDP-4-amino-4,6-dideoxygalactose transaminase
MGFQPGDFPEAEEYYREAISIPMHPTLTTSEQDYVVSSIKEAMRL